MNERFNAHGPAAGVASPARLRESLEAALEHIRDYAIVLIDGGHRIAGWNRGAQYLLGYSADEAIGSHTELFFTPEDRAAGVPAQELKAALWTGKAADERWHVRRDGTRFFGSGIVTPVKDESGTLLGFVKIFRDATEQRRAVEALARSEDRYRLLVDSISDYAIFMMDADGRVTYWTKAAERIKGYTQAEILGQPFTVFFTQDDIDRGEPARELRLARERGRAERVGLRVRKDGSTFWGDEIVTALRDESGMLMGFSKITRDITDRREAEIERERLLRQATESNRLKDEFLSTISHELRTPLNAVLGWAQLLRLRGADAGMLPRALDVIERNARAQARLIDDLLDVSGIVTGKTRLNPQHVSLAEPLQAALETVRPAAQQKGIDLRVQNTMDRDGVWGDTARLQQIIWNVLANAIKFTPAGGTVTVSASSREVRADLEVSDTGVGIDPAVLPFVFDRFRQGDTSTTRTHAGLGLGLSIVKHLVELHGGEVAIDSSGPGQGTTVRLHLPLVSRESTQAASSPESPADVSPILKGVSVLVVDDEADARDLLGAVLSLKGARVSLAASAAEGIDIARRVHPDVILTDLAMPGEDGFTLLKYLRRSDPALQAAPVVAVTAYVRGEDRRRCLVAGFDGYVAKPIEVNELVDLVAALASGQPAPDETAH